MESSKSLHLNRLDSYKEVDARHKEFIEEGTCEIDARYVERRSCPTCQSNRERVIFRKNGGTYVMCGSCSMVYLNPVFRDDELQKYYENNNTVQAGAHQTESEFYTTIYKQGLGSLMPFVSSGRILDIGCSSGLFLDIARVFGFDTCGIELNSAERRIASNRGHTIWGSPLEKINRGERFNVITLWDVFEHIKDGSALLGEMRERLTVGGVVFLQVPNVASLASRALWDRCNMFDGIEHVNLYSPSTIRLLAEKQGFEILCMATVIDELAVTKNYLSYQDPYFGDFFESNDLGFLDSRVIHENLLGYKIQVILRPLS
jgi:2-polyprenyl-3-methyl-5-hydroxy-6-metoxy-1,4-benzoquinol methylase